VLLEVELNRSKPINEDNVRLSYSNSDGFAIIPVLSSCALCYKPRRPSEIVGDAERTTSFTAFDRHGVTVAGRMTVATILQFYPPSHGINFNYSTMPRPLEPVERAAFFSECTLAGLRECIKQPG